MDPALQAPDGGRRRRRVRRGRAAVIAAVVAYALVPAVCRPLTGAALGAVLLAGAPLCWVGVRRRPRRTEPVGGRSATVWLGLGGLATAFELGVWLGPDDAAHAPPSSRVSPRSWV